MSNVTTWSVFQNLVTNVKTTVMLSKLVEDGKVLNTVITYCTPNMVITYLYRVFRHKGCSC